MTPQTPPSRSADREVWTELFTLGMLRSTYQDATQTASTIVRQLAFAGIGFVWVFSIGSDVTVRSKLVVPSNLLWVGLLLAICLTLDLVQSLYKSAMFGVIGREVEKHPEDFSGLIPKWVNWPTNALFWVKAGVLGVAYFILAWILADLIH